MVHPWRRSVRSRIVLGSSFGGMMVDRVMG
jgi:hypothetical protein